MPQIQENSKFHLKNLSRNHVVFGRKLTCLADLVGFWLVSFESLPTKIGRNLPGFKNLLGFNSNASEFGRNLTGLADLVGFFLAGFYPPNINKNCLFVQNSYFYPIQLQ